MAEEPYALTLWTFFQIMERERIEQLLARGRRLDAALLMAAAYNDPKVLREEHQDYIAELRLPVDRRARTQRREELLARGLALAEAIERGGVLDDGPPPAPGEIPIMTALAAKE